LIDLSEVEYIASLGLGLLISAAKGLKRHGANMVLLNPQTSVENVLTASGFNENIPITHDFNEALEILKAGRVLLGYQVFWYFISMRVISSA